MKPGRLLFLFAIAAAVVLPVRLWMLEPIYIATGSMEPTLHVGVHLFCDKLTLRARALRRGEIVVLRVPEREEEGDLVKRVIALPGETVELREKKVLVNGSPLDEPYAQHRRAEERLVGDNLGPFAVPEGMIFVLGDNRDESKDSSVWKDAEGRPDPFVPLREVAGVVRGIF